LWPTLRHFGSSQNNLLAFSFVSFLDQTFGFCSDLVMSFQMFVVKNDLIFKSFYISLKLGVNDCLACNYPKSKAS